MRKGTTSTGFAYEFDETRADDMRFVELLAEMESDEVGSFTQLAAAGKATALLLGREGKKALYDHIGAANEGRVPTAALFGELQDIMSGEDAEKNS